MSDELAEEKRHGRVKCVVWDLDHTLWDGVLLEDGAVTVKPEVVAAIHALDGLGILHSIASKNDHDAAWAQVEQAGLAEMFLFPQIGWNAKSHSVQQIAKKLNIGLDALAFVDDQEFERAEVAAACPQVIGVDPAGLAAALETAEFRPRFVTEESRQRRAMYRSQISRDDEEENFVGTGEEFLAQLGLVVRIESAARDDLQRAEELTVRTNQLNSTGRTYSYDELDKLRGSDDHLLYVVTLDDRFGSYGKIGLVLIERTSAAVWHLRLLLMSCRVLSRGVGTIVLNHLLRQARDAGVALHADLIETGRNRMMQIAYAFAGFREIDRDGSHVTLRADLGEIPPVPPYVRLLTD
ncbi:HAD-IIIC family phosphatase [Micromonospora sp. KC207]|uniref:HAD-IIIC family phosphatase n=1 Tax=Micromonospora sp. KC207 TaxID=2530377 RepID=UPI0010498BB7|nr:HAD-IIIC family phosphatase [Micromonospora sp. KC207]TDC63754.1 HAD-IIIC family phosphatase [Micromonospora sp. KC207]